MKKGSKKCPDCKAVNDNKASFCIKCGANLDKDKVASVTDKKSVKNKENGSSFLQDKGNVMALVSLLLLFMLPFYLIGLGIMIMGRQLYPDNKFLKIVMWIYITFVIIYLIFFIFLYISCGNLGISCC